ncbi:LexA family protein [Aureibacter tunicatorum]|uniref:DNA polymerase V n=1 Tax=Aureibacter tunicatorum TaxID=866807 RepID=A0AAE3XIB0_9BACT|nr:translesion error-prone DNA polymerase V autoproteolytic subunit [Aureibacter tunicatorum]MDR6238236.1 DNA polymerase V [Aureibacter tunicatorum]BDD03269.1 SOS response transcriptional regulator [Aureibacter tunicatorum]
MISFYQICKRAAHKVTFVAGYVQAGIPSAVEDSLEGLVDLNAELVNNVEATFYVRVEGEAMKDEGIYSGDVLVIDRSIIPKEGDVVVCCIDGEFMVDRLCSKEGVLQPLMKKRGSVGREMPEKDGFMIWGVVTYAIHKQL